MINFILSLADYKADVMKVVVVAPKEADFDNCFPNAMPTAFQWVDYHGSAQLCFCLPMFGIVMSVMIIIIFHFVNFKTFDILFSEVSFIVQIENKPVCFMFHVTDFLSENSPVFPSADATIIEVTIIIKVHFFNSTVFLLFILFHSMF